MAFAIFAMPADVFASLIDGAGLPLVLSAAQPPLGSTARLAVMAAGAATSFVSVWLLLSGLDRWGKQRTEIVAEPEWFAPRVRRADAHPDAPLRRPIFAGSDLGEPGEDDFVSDSRWLDMAATVPGQRAEEIDMPGAFEAGAFAVDEPAEASETVEGTEPAPSLESDPAPVATTLPEAAWAAPSETDHDDLLDLRHDQVADEAEVPADDEDISTEALMARLPLPDGRSESVSHLIERLDAGLAACEWPLAAASPGSPPEPADNRLQAALDELQRMASRG
ncbi:MAG: hypothetical protein JWN69_925 [Alphaproteobacteria bacterium]|nr:hypothetical protein [Alphaproteobacteria bacterium]